MSKVAYISNFSAMRTAPPVALPAECRESIHTLHTTLSFPNPIAPAEQGFPVLLHQPLRSVLTRFQVSISFHILQHPPSENNKAALPAITGKAA